MNTLHKIPKLYFNNIPQEKLHCRHVIISAKYITLYRSVHNLRLPVTLYRLHAQRGAATLTQLQVSVYPLFLWRAYAITLLYKHSTTRISPAIVSLYLIYTIRFAGQP